MKLSSRKDELMAVSVNLAGNGFLPRVVDDLLLGDEYHGAGVLAFMGVVVFFLTFLSGDVVFLASLLWSVFLWVGGDFLGVCVSAGSWWGIGGHGWVYLGVIGVPRLSMAWSWCPCMGGWSYPAFVGSSGCSGPPLGWVVGGWRVVGWGLGGLSWVGISRWSRAWSWCPCWLA